MHDLGIMRRPIKLLPEELEMFRKRGADELVLDLGARCILDFHALDTV